MINSKPLFSVITICYNSSETIEQTLKSVLAQSFTDYEYIIVDGVSKDSTLDIIKKYEPMFEGRMKWVSEPDKGIYNAMNKGLERSNGDIISIVNSDDWLEPDALGIIANIAKNIKSFDDVLYCGSIYFHYEKGEKQLFTSNKERFYAGIPNYSYNYGAYHPAILVGRKVYKTVGNFDEGFKIEADTDFVYRCYKAGKKFVFTESVLSNMADGGASNEIIFSKYYNEKKYFLKKNNIKGFPAIVIMVKFLIKISIKKCVPNKFIKIIRSFKK